MSPRKLESELAIVAKLEDLDRRYPDLNPAQIERALMLKRAYMGQGGFDRARTETKPQDLATDVVRLEAQTNITLSEERALQLMSLLGLRLEGSDDPTVVSERIFTEQRKENARIILDTSAIASETADRVSQI